jgi:glycosyltransferase involved in cell wall biosynthesis
MDFLYDNSSSDDKYHFLISSTIYKIIEVDINKALTKNKNTVVEVIDDEELTSIFSSKTVFIRAWKEREVIRKYVIKHKIDILLFLQIDAYQFIVGYWGFKKLKKVEIRGILFEPYIQQPINEGLSGFKIAIKHLRKNLQLRWMLLNKSLNHIFIFNDVESTLKLNTVLGRDKLFKYLPDPIKFRTFKHEDIKATYKIPQEKKVLLFIGGVQRRKNITSIIEAIGKLENKDKDKICLLILGKCNEKALLDEINTSISNNNDFQIIFDNNFVYSDKLESAFEQSDLVFLVYSKFYASSAIIGNAAKHKKYIIACNYGVIGNLSEKYNLGKAVNPNSIAEISSAIGEFMDGNYNYNPNLAFCESHSPEKFITTLLQD